MLFISFIFLAKVGAEINGNRERKLPRKKKTEDFFSKNGDMRNSTAKRKGS